MTLYRPAASATAEAYTCAAGPPRQGEIELVGVVHVEGTGMDILRTGRGVTHELSTAAIRRLVPGPAGEAMVAVCPPPTLWLIWERLEPEAQPTRIETATTAWYAARVAYAAERGRRIRLQ